MSVGFRRYLLYLWGTVLVVLGLVTVRLPTYQEFSHLADVLVVGLMFGTMFAQTSLAAGWTALGPLPLIWRLPLSLVWVLILCKAWAMHNAAQSNGSQGAAGIIGIFLMLQWLVLQPPLWVVSMGCGVRLRHHGDRDRSMAGQFSIRHLLGLMAITGCALMIARSLSAELSASFERVGEWSVYRSQCLAAAIMCFPLLLAAMLPGRHALWTIVALIPFGSATAWEPYFLEVVGHHWLTEDHLIAINLVMAVWIIVFALAVRLCGYGLTTSNQIAGDSQIVHQGRDRNG